MSKVKYAIAGIVAVVIIVLFFIPTSEFGIDSKNSEPPAPITVLSNYPEEFEINPQSCLAQSGNTEFEFTVQNKLDEDYRLEIHLVLSDENMQDLAKQAILVEVGAEQTSFEKHQIQSSQDGQRCTIELKRIEKISELGIDAQSLSEGLENNEPILIVDTRTAEQYMSNHINGASHDIFDSATLQKRIPTIQNKLPDVTLDYKFVIVDEDESLSKQAAYTLSENGFNAFYLKGGIDSWTGQFSAKQTPTIITSEDLYQQMKTNEEFYLLDVREPSELEATMISGSTNIPLAGIFNAENIADIPTDKPVIVICGSGNRATIATYELAQYGIDFQVLEGGIKAWDDYLKENNLPKQ